MATLSENLKIRPMARDLLFVTGSLTLSQKSERVLLGDEIS